MGYPTDDFRAAHEKPASPSRRFPLQREEGDVSTPTIPWEMAERA